MIIKIIITSLIMKITLYYSFTFWIHCKYLISLLTLLYLEYSTMLRLNPETPFM